jgi:NADH-quinone oxidoreductase subunit M
MPFTSIPWLELAVAVGLLGTLVVGRLRDPLTAANVCLAFVSTLLTLCIAAWVAFAVDPTASPQGVLTYLLGRPVLMLDELNAPLVPGIALLHWLTVLATARTKMVRFSFSRLLLGAAIRVATFACLAPVDLALLLLIGVLPPYLELRARKRPTGVYLLHMGLFIALLLGGLATSGTVSAVLLMAAVLLRSGTFPLHVWVTDLFENGSFGTALLTVAPITGMYAALRLVLPIPTPDWILQSIGAASLCTALYAAGMALVQTEARRFFAFLVLSHAALVLVGMELHTTISLTGALALWPSLALSLVGFGLTLRALEARFDRLALTEYRGLYSSCPPLAVGFLLTGLACVGFPGTSGFLASELLIDGALTVNPIVGITVVIVAALNGVAVLRVYLLLFTGKPSTSRVSLHITPREQTAFLILSALILLGGLLPQFAISNRHQAAEMTLAQRATQ